MADYARLGLKDYDGEPSSTTFHTVEITAANLDAQATAFGTLRTALEAIMLQSWNSGAITDEVYSSFAAVTDQFSQREIKWQVTVQDSSGNRYRGQEIPCADIGILEGGSKYIYKNGVVTVVTAATLVQNVVDAYEAFVKDRFGNALTVIDIYQVGRNV